MSSPSSVCKRQDDIHTVTSRYAHAGTAVPAGMPVFNVYLTFLVRKRRMISVRKYLLLSPYARAVTNPSSPSAPYQIMNLIQIRYKMVHLRTQIRLTTLAQRTRSHHRIKHRITLTIILSRWSNIIVRVWEWLNKRLWQVWMRIPCDTKRS